MGLLNMGSEHIEICFIRGVRSSFSPSASITALFTLPFIFLWLIMEWSSVRGLSRCDRRFTEAFASVRAFTYLIGKIRERLWY
jgi:hypothetical protein